MDRQAVRQASVLAPIAAASTFAAGRSPMAAVLCAAVAWIAAYSVAQRRGA